MGCFNETCGISQLPICDGDNVLCFVLAEKKSILREKPGIMFYPDGIFNVIMPPISGEYDDYGGIIDIEYNPVCENIMGVLDLYEINENYGEKEYKKFTPSNLEDFLGAIIRGNVYLKTKGIKVLEEYLLLSAMYVHSDLYTRLMAEISSRRPCGFTKTIKVLLKEKAEKAINKIPSDKSFRCERFSDNYSYRDMGRGFDLLEYLASTVAIGQLDMEVGVELIVDLDLFNQCLELLRKGYDAHCGKGCQSREYYLHKIIAEYVLQKCEDVKTDSEEKDDSVLKESIYFYET